MSELRERLKQNLVRLLAEIPQYATPISPDVSLRTAGVTGWRAGELTAHLVAIATAVRALRTENELEARVLHDGCIGDDAGYKSALEAGYAVLDGHYSDEGWGHHSYDEVVVLEDGRVISAHCGGCSCEGHGSWEFVDGVETARRLVPEQQRDV